MLLMSILDLLKMIDFSNHPFFHDQYFTKIFKLIVNATDFIEIDYCAYIKTLIYAKFRI